MKQSEDGVRADQVTEEVSAPPVTTDLFAFVGCRHFSTSWSDGITTCASCGTVLSGTHAEPVFFGSHKWEGRKCAECGVDMVDDEAYSCCEAS